MRLVPLALGLVITAAACSAPAPQATLQSEAPPASSPATTSAPPASAGEGTRRLQGVPDDFVRVRDTLPGALFEIRYYGDHNFMGRPVNGYAAPECWLTKPTADALAKVQRTVSERGYTIKIYDCFRPQRAVDDFVAWAGDPMDTTTQREFFPELRKSQLFPLGYIAAKSGHSRGSTLDLTLVPEGDGVSPEWAPGDPLVPCTEPVARRFPDTSIDMGTGFDCFDPLANTANPQITPEQRRNRRYLVRVMRQAGFTNLPEEWWHYTLRDEPYPDTYFDAEVTDGAAAQDLGSAR